ncbi:MAG: hypothetical protein JNM47_11655 [Hyphomonadaceae bacterium]|nr:hypothetical protein [Hyphomonadaceae bacterium]
MTRIRLAAAALLAASFFGAGLLATTATAQDSGAVIALPPKEPERDDGSINIPGAIDRPVVAPDGDPRTPDQRRRDARAYDRCINRAAAKQSEIGIANPVAQDPEEYCRSRMGMASRNAVPDSRLKRQ